MDQDPRRNLKKKTELSRAPILRKAIEQTIKELITDKMNQ